jgi:hypothetical protein
LREDTSQWGDWLNIYIGELQSLGDQGNYQYTINLQLYMYNTVGRTIQVYTLTEQHCPDSKTSYDRLKLLRSYLATEKDQSNLLSTKNKLDG